MGEHSGEDFTRIEDYLEAISLLIKKKGYARTADIASHLKVRSPAVTRMIQKLDKEGYLKYEKYRGISLTGKGKEIAETVESKHRIISEFLEMLGIKGKIAYEDAEGIEHHVHKETLDKITKLVEFLKKNPYWLKKLNKFLEQ
ncbi:MAG: transcriptional regulator MntR [Nitrososphaerales archaeon]